MLRVRVRIKIRVVVRVKVMVGEEYCSLQFVDTVEVTFLVTRLFSSYKPSMFL